MPLSKSHFSSFSYTVITIYAFFLILSNLLEASIQQEGERSKCLDQSSTLASFASCLQFSSITSSDLSCAELSNDALEYIQCLDKFVITPGLEHPGHGPLNEDNCAQAIELETLTHEKDSFHKFYVKNYHRVVRDGQNIAQSIFSLRTRFKELLTTFYLNDHYVQPACISAFRKAIRYFRFAEELAMEASFFNIATGTGNQLQIHPIAKHHLSGTDQDEKKWQKYIEQVATFHHIHPTDADDLSLGLSTLKKPFKQFLVSPKYQNETSSFINWNNGQLDIKSGDILLMRTSTFVSGVIARSSDDSGHFSHLVLAYWDKSQSDEQNPKGKLYTVEALIETGMVKSPWKEWVSRSNHGRIAIYRLKDERYAEEMAKRVYELAIPYNAFMEYDYSSFKQKNKIVEFDYDFSMDMNDNSSIFCAETARYGGCMSFLAMSGQLGHLSQYENQNHLTDKYSDYKKLTSQLCIDYYKNHVNQSGLHLPTFPSRFDHFKGHPFLTKGLGIKEGIEIFSPNDMEIEPLVDLVAEWKNPILTRDIRVSDAIYESVMEWMYQKKYWPTEKLHQKVLTEMAMSLRKHFNIGRDKLRLDMPKNFLRMVFSLNTIDTILKNNIFPIERAYFEKHYHSMNFSDIQKILEEFRIQDCIKYKKGTYTDTTMVGEKNHTSNSLHKFLAPYPDFDEGFEERMSRMKRSDLKCL